MRNIDRGGTIMFVDPALIQTCAPTVAPSTVQSIIQVESKGNPLAINVNGTKLARQPRDIVDATALATAYIKAGYSVDLGLMQVNSKNLSKLGYTISDMFIPCKNLSAGAQILTKFYTSGREQMIDPQIALRAALSAYNTGNFISGFRNGYVARYFAGSLLTKFGQFTAENKAQEKDDSSSYGQQIMNPYTANTVVYVRHEETILQK
ncbi:Attachment mediating protein VirB1 [Granulibacter bethesdensis]|uniref:Attachment mediating protein VirB1 n=2 Tax=Granulibacter bethesdensis TaxID=364410 RepID=A0AAN0VFW9_9PROT|nr:Attachment mediating protein VirB1 [Granulibacter bethesdensis]